MVSVPKTNPIPQLSIVVPVFGDSAAFEATLVSVLENQPSCSEVIVAHDGSYDDPFDLADEVRLVESQASTFGSLVGSASHQARGRFVHVLGGGLLATEGWTDSAVHLFDHFDTAAVSPLIQYRGTGELIAAGWKNRLGRLMEPSLSVPKEDQYSSRTVGAYLPASFWRRDVLRSLQDSFDGDDLLETSLVYHYLLRKAGWRTELAAGSRLQSDSGFLPWDQSGVRRGMRLAALRDHFIGASKLQSLISAGIACARTIIQPSLMGDSFGQLLSPFVSQVEDSIHEDSVLSCDQQGMIVTLSRSGSSSIRRAA